MNGQNPNTLNNSENNLNGTTLGSTTLGQAQMPNPNLVQNTVPNQMPAQTPTPSPMPNLNGPVANPSQIPNTNVEQVETPVQINSNPVNNNVPPVSQAPSEPTPVAQPIPGTDSSVNLNNLTGNTIGSGNLGFNQTSQGFMENRKMENIGIVPPPNTEPQKNNKKSNKLLFILLIIVLIAGVAFGVYYFLSVSNNKVKLTTNEITINLGETIPDDIASYAKVVRGNINKCSLNTSLVDTSKLGKYKVTITCGKDNYTTNVNVSDKEAPKVELNVVFKTVNTSVNIEDFVRSCNDPSNCKTSYVNEETVNNYLLTAGGPYKVEIQAADDSQNKKTYTTDLYVTSEDVFLFLDCSTNEEALTSYKAKKVTSDIFPISRNNFAFLQVARRDYIYTFETEEEYKKAIGNRDNEITFDNITGSAIYDDANLKLIISTDLSLEKLNSENNGAFPTNYSDIQRLYAEKEGYAGPQILKTYPQYTNTEESE